MSGLPLSICIPTYNRARLLDRTLRHLHEHRALFSEIVVSDNASTDDTQRVVQRWTSDLTELRYVRQSENRGAMRNFFASLSLATAEYAFALSDDDFLIPHGIAAGVSALASDADCVALYGGYEMWDSDFTTLQARLPPPNPGRFTKRDWHELALNSYQLTFPIVRREIFQRHCFFDDTTFGLWRLIGQLLNHGSLLLIAEPLYRHAETADRIEQRSDEAWYHDSLRADWELYVASIGRMSSAMLGEFVAARTARIYVSGLDYAQKHDRPLLERTFLMRYLAYDHGPEAAEAAAQRAVDWERTRLIAAVTEQLIDRVMAEPGLRRIIVQLGPMNIATMLAAVHAKLPGLEIVGLDTEHLLAFEARTGDLVLVEYWETLVDLRARRGWTSISQVAVGDIVRRLRPRVDTPTPLLQGRDGALHFSRI